MYSYIDVLLYRGNIDTFVGVSRTVFQVMGFRASIFVPVSAMLFVPGFIPFITLADSLMFAR